MSSPVYGISGGLSKKELSHNERFYEEYEYERRLKKRRAKLITATEEAFAHIKRQPTEHMKGKKNIEKLICVLGLKYNYEEVSFLKFCESS